jgi:threonine dehydratase
VIDQGLWRTGRLIRLRCMVQDVPGALSRLLGVIANTQANVLEVEHERVGDWLELGQSMVEILLETRGFEHVTSIEEALRVAGVAAERAEVSKGPRRRSGPS